MTLTVRTANAALLRSKATRIAFAFIAAMAIVLVVLVGGMPAAGFWRTLYTVAAFGPGLGIVAAAISWIFVSIRRRKPVLIIDDRIHIVHSGVSFPVTDLARLVITRAGLRSQAVLLPRHLVQETRGLEAYTVEFPPHPDPRPFELVEYLSARVPGLVVDK